MSFKKLLLELFFPSFCVNCGQLGPFLCESCYQLVNFAWQKDFTSNLAKNFSTLYFDQLRVMAQFKKPLSSLIKQLKYQHNRTAGRFLAQMLYFHLMLDYQNLELITFIPLHPKKLKWRGYNQAQLIAEELGLWTGLPALNLLERQKNNRTQASISNSLERQKNTAGIFSLPEKKLNLLRNRRILLLDDVVTTGSTLNEAARILKKAGAKSITAVALASRID